MSSEEDRWTTKFLLKEHISAYDERYEKNSGDQPSEEELVMMRDYILLPHLLTVVQRNIDKLKPDKALLKMLYLGLAEHIASSIERDLYSLRKELVRRNLYISPGDMDDDFVLNFIYRYRGYSGNFGITREELKTQMSLRLSKYVDGIFEVLSKVHKR
jgi:hypothetical protein